MKRNRANQKKKKFESDDFYNSNAVEEKYKDFMRVIDPLFNDIYEGKQWKHLDENIMRKTYVDSVTRRNKEWVKSHNCIYPGCVNYSINKSHTIQRATSIKYISENGHVLTPSLKEHPDKIEYNMKRIGINDASTFPGFCEEHEKIFASFEKEGVFKSEEDYKLQVFRTICREIVFNKHKLDSLKESYDSYIEQINNLFIKKLHEHYGKTLNELGIKNIKVENKDTYKKLHDDSITKIENKLKRLEELLEAYSSDGIANFNINIPFQIPVAISGISNTDLLNKKSRSVEDGIIILNCLPVENSTILIVSVLGCYEDAILEILKYRTQSKLFILSFIESFMINGTEHWFIKESIWNMLNELKKKQVLNDIFYSNWNIQSDYQYSIFDDIRRELINEGEDAVTQQDVHQSLIEHLNIEKQKLMNLPQNIRENTVDLTYKAANDRLKRLNKRGKA